MLLHLQPITTSSRVNRLSLVTRAGPEKLSLTLKTIITLSVDKEGSGVQVFLDTFPQLVGTKFGDLVYRFADGIVLGLLNRRSGACDIAPPAETLVRPHRQS